MTRKGKVADHILQERFQREGHSQYFDIVGMFKVNSGEVVISDPCYDFNKDNVLDDVRNGIWRAYIERLGFRPTPIHSIYVAHDSYTPPPSFQSSEWEEFYHPISVDSGQAGIYDRPTFRNDEIVHGKKYEPTIDEDEPGDRWYNLCCYVTHPVRGPGAGVLPGGFVSSSGYGDGTYSAYFIRDKAGQIVAIKIQFVEAEPDEEDGTNFF